MKRFFVAFATPWVLAASVGIASAQGTVQTISFTPASPVAPGTNVAVTVTASNPCGAIGIEYGDGASSVYPISALPLTQTHVYPNAGTFTVRATGHGNCSGQITATLVVSAPPPPPPPPPPTQGVLEDMTFSPAAPVANTTVTIRLTGSNPCTRVRIRSGSNILFEPTFPSLPATTAITFASAGTHEVRAEGLAAGQCGGVVTRTVTVAPKPPPPAGAVQSLSVAPSPAPVGTNVAITLTGTTPCGAVRIQFGDGTSVDRTVTAFPHVENRVYSTAGTFAIRAYGSSNCGGDFTRELSITPPAPSGDAKLEAFRPDLELLDVTQNPATPIQSGGPVNYTVTVRNAGRTSVQSALLRVRFESGGWQPRAGGLPAGCAMSQAAAPNSAVDCTMAMSASSRSTLEFRMTAPTLPASRESERLTILARVDPDNVVVEGSESNNLEAHITSVVKLPDLDPDASGLPTAADAANNIIYPVRMANTGQGGARNAVLLTRLPAYFELVRIENTNATCTTEPSPSPRESGPAVRCTMSQLPAGEVLRANIVARATGTELDGRMALLTMQADPDDTVQEASETNNTAGVATTLSAMADLRIGSYTVRYESLIRLPRDVRLPVTPPDLSCRKTGNTEIRITVRNDGPAASPATTLQMNYASGFTRGTRDCAEGATCMDDGGCRAGVECFDSCPVPRLLAGQSHEVRIRAERNGDHGVIATASVGHAGRDANPDNNSRSIRREGGGAPAPLVATLPDLTRRLYRLLGLSMPN